MDFSAETWWWLAAGIVVVIELSTGTFYLLMLALGLSAGAVATHLGAGLTSQTITAALVAGFTTAIWHWSRFRYPQSPPVAENKDVHQDIGETVKVTSWSPEGTAGVFYRGSHWQARRQVGASEGTGLHRIVAFEGNTLILSPLKDSK